MNKKLIWSIGVIALVALLVTSVGVKVALAQDETPETPETPLVSDHPHGGRGGHDKHGPRGMSDTALAAAAEVLSMTTDELSTELQAGTTIATLAEQAGVDEQDVWDAIQAAKEADLRAEIAQAVEDGTMTQEKADWLLEGLDKGFLSDGFGFGLHPHFGHPIPPETNESTDE